MKGSEIRAAFLRYFEERDHKVVASSSLVPQDDPTLLFANAGMNQFKDIFLGRVTRPYLRATTSQKVVRAGGKHNDLENVGRTSRHHTFFEMLGNFSFGDYFKRDAILYAWEFLTKVLGLPADKMFVSVYKDDEEAFLLWRDMVGLDESKIIRKGEKDNFWQMGDTGPCGPCSEIHIDQGVGTGCGSPDCSPDCDCDRHLELWNLVFMQYNRSADGTLQPLPMPSIDTGMGLERVTSVVQQVTSNYDTDLLLPIIDYTAKLAHVAYGEDPSHDVSLRVIADHARSTTFLISDGVLPSNEGRGYVLRRIMRRAMRHGNNLGFEGAFFHKVCTFVIDFMKDHYVELADKAAFVDRVVLAEEGAFSRTLNTGLRIIHEEIFNTIPQGSTIPGETIFKLYDTYGFPVDLLTDILEDAGYKMDMEEYDKFMAVQQEKAKKAGMGNNKRALSDVITRLGSINKSEFMGYDSLVVKGSVLSVVQNGEMHPTAEGGEVEIVTDITSFYPEGGGQVGDTGVIAFPHGTMQVERTYRAGGAIVHKGKMMYGKVGINDIATMQVDEHPRRATEKNHTATHILHKALQTVLGEHVRQAGSMVSPDGFRFDFTHSAPMTQSEINEVMHIMYKVISEARPVVKTFKTQDEAIREGAMALFGEKYGNIVRVVEVKGFSKELCGGCHVQNSSDIDVIVIVSETGVASGVRRIEGCTGTAAVKYLIHRSAIVTELSNHLHAQPNDLMNAIVSTQERVKEMERELKVLRGQSAMIQAKNALNSIREVAGVQVVAVRLDGMAMEDLRNVVDDIASSLRENAIILVASVLDDKVNFACRVSVDLTKRFKAGALIKEVAKVAGGSGGGRDDAAQAGGKDISKADDAINKIYELVKGS